jgi:parallel beta-helix repeat protein
MSDNGGGIYLYESSQASLSNCLIKENTAYDQGGAFFVWDSSPTFFNCTVVNNLAWDYGGGIFLWDSSPIVTNCIFWNNQPDEIDIYRYDETSNPEFSYSDVQGGHSGECNIDENPLFVGSDNYQLTASSPCIDTGTSSGAPDILTIC